MVCANAESAAIIASFVRRFPRDWGKCSLEEGVVNYVTLVIFAFDDPVAGKDFALPAIGEDYACMRALLGLYKKWSAGPEGFHLIFSPSGVVQPPRCISSLCS